MRARAVLAGVAVVVSSQVVVAADPFVTLFPENGQAVLQGSKKLTLYSLEPIEEHRPSKPTFHGYTILGRIKLRGDARDELLGKLYSAIATRAEPARCFVPRHGIRATSGDKTIDLVICFQCRQVKSYLGDRRGHSTLSDGPEAFFNKILTSAGVPLTTH